MCFDTVRMLCFPDCGKLHAAPQSDLSASLLRLILGTLHLTYHLLCAGQHTSRYQLLFFNTRQKGNRKQASIVADRNHSESQKILKSHLLWGFTENIIFLVFVNIYPKFFWFVSHGQTVKKWEKNTKILCLTFDSGCCEANIVSDMG